MKSILLIEDDTDIPFILNHILEEKGYKVYCSVTGDEIEELTSIVPDLVLLDLRLSGAIRTGAEIYLKDRPFTKYLPVILVSAERDIAEIASACGADDYIRKPFNIDHLN